MKRFGLALFALLLGLAPAQPQNAGWPPPAGAQAMLCVYNSTPPTLTNGQVGFVNCDAAGNLVTGGGGTLDAVATAAAPSYAEGASEALSMDLAGNLRVIASGIAQGASTAGQTGSLIFGSVTTAAPSYTNGQVSPLSLDAAGGLRSSLAATQVAIPLWGHGATAAAVPANAVYQGVNVGGNLVGLVGDPCQTGTKVYTPISQTANTVLVSATASVRIHICQIIIVAGAAEAVSLVEGTGSVCGTSTGAVMGSTTAANGMSFSANGGVSVGQGGFAVARTPTVNTDLCLYQDGSDRIAGSIVTVKQ